MITRLSLVLLFCFSALLFSKDIQWLSSVKEAERIAKKENKNMFLYFTGSDWCPWCAKMKKEILENPAFQKIAEPLFVFVMVDFPQNNYLTKEEKEQNFKLKEEYGIEGFPTVVLLDKNLSLISVLGYLPTTGVKYARHLKKLLFEHADLSFTGDIEKLSEEEKQKIYEKARSLGTMLQEPQENSSLELAEDPFYHLQEYNLLISDFNEEVLDSAGACLKEVLFEYMKNLQTEKSENAVLPLLEYIRNFGSKDKNHLWQIEMIVSQFFYSQGDIEKALLHAKECYKAAPLVMRKDLVKAILFIKSRMKSKY